MVLGFHSHDGRRFYPTCLAYLSIHLSIYLNNTRERKREEERRKKYVSSVLCTYIQSHYITLHPKILLFFFFFFFGSILKRASKVNF
ncbi:hypothetical protein QBC44DRAFT_316180 [Cladorrhinum sp. PSN332]|nr:hypothetical protein QBC44DRAFT_316180 [Cladorrhinum sp. PSN332]